MKAQADRLRISASAQDRIRPPRVFWAGPKPIDLNLSSGRSNLPLTIGSGESLSKTTQVFAVCEAIRELSNDMSGGVTALTRYTLVKGFREGEVITVRVGDHDRFHLFAGRLFAGVNAQAMRRAMTWSIALTARVQEPAPARSGS